MFLDCLGIADKLLVFLSSLGRWRLLKRPKITILDARGKATLLARKNPRTALTAATGIFLLAFGAIYWQIDRIAKRAYSTASVGPIYPLCWPGGRLARPARPMAPCFSMAPFKWPTRPRARPAQPLTRAASPTPPSHCVTAISLPPTADDVTIVGNRIVTRCNGITGGGTRVLISGNTIEELPPQPQPSQ